ncbi:MAG: 3-hydroxyacyl-CoA dehydrogenase NAD-binding domain-containing protein [Burkholderiales bacterium]
MINSSIDQDGIATIEWDMQGHTQNILNDESIEAFGAAVSKALADPAVKGLLIASAKKDFIAGADLEMVLRHSEAEHVYSQMLEWHKLLRHMETAGKPVAAALSGTALGGGLELALGCHYRVAADNPKAGFGFPEVTLGLLPGGGGTQRVPRLIGIEAAAPLLTQGKRLKAGEALKLGLIDEVVPPGEERAAARAWLLGEGQSSARQPWDEEGFRIPGGEPSAPLRAKTHAVHAAPHRILVCLEEGARTDLETALEIEARHFANLVVSSEAKNMVRTLFFAMNEANSLSARPKGILTQKYRRMGMLGAGMMGSGIAYATAHAGIEVVLLDADQKAAERGKDYARKLLSKMEEKGRMTPQAVEAVLARITPTTDFAALQGCELVVEGVFEDRAVKAEVTRKAEAALQPDAVFASNTSTLPITGLARASRRPENFIGLHFFSPAERMPLVEIIRGDLTSDTTLARAMDFVKALGKTPVVVHDGRGFYTSRVLRAYLSEAAALLEEGVAPDLIENASLIAGMPIGPLALIDDVSLELMIKFAKQDKADLGSAYRESAIDRVAALMVEQLGRPGRKAGKGFYDYPADGKKHLWPGLAAHFPLKAEQPTVEAVVERLILIQSVETARCMEEGVVTRPQDADVGAVLGWGYPSLRGGPIGWIHTMGVPEFVAACDRLAEDVGPRFGPPELLRAMMKKGEAFYHL